MNFRLTEAPIAPTLATMTVLTAFGLLAIVGFAVADAYFVGLLGKEELASITYCFPVLLFFSGLGVGLGVGTEIVLAPMVDTADTEQKRVLASRALLLATLISIGVSAGIYGLTSAIANGMSAAPELHGDIELYLRLWVVGGPPLIVALVGGSLARTVGDMLTPAAVMITASLLNLVLDPILIFGFPGVVAPMHFAGAAWATLLTRCLAGACTVWLLVYKYDLLTTKRLWHRDTLVDWGRILQAGGPPAALQGVIPAGQALLLKLLAVFPVTVIAGVGLALQVETLAFVLFMGLNISLGPFVGQNMGVGKIDRIERALAMAIGACGIIGVMLMLFFRMLGPSYLPMLHGDSNVIIVLVAYFLWVPLSYPVEGIRFIASPTFNNTGSSLPPLLIATFKYFAVLLPLAYMVRDAYGWMGVIGAIAAARFATASLAGIWMGRRLYTVRNRALSSDHAV